MRILLTGASSFTGYWLADALIATGAEVVAPLRGCLEDGDAARRERLRRLTGRCELLPEAPLGSQRLHSLAAATPFDVVWLHAAEVGDFRAPDYHPLLAAAAGTAGVGRLLDDARCPAVVATGSVFEADEGKGDRPGAIGVYGLAKTLAWQVVRFEAERRGLALRKLVIAHPFGPLEKQGLTRAILRAWREGAAATVRHSWLMRDFLPVTSMAAAAAAWALAAPSGSRFSPSAFAETVGVFAERLASMMRPRLGVACAIELTPEFCDEPAVRVGFDRMVPCESRFWDDYAGIQLTCG